jgi:hypothetical protein
MLQRISRPKGEEIIKRGQDEELDKEQVEGRQTVLKNYHKEPRSGLLIILKLVNSI